MISWPTDRCILLLAGYRTGSTALCSHISQVTGHENFDEIWHRSFRRRTTKWREHENQGGLWVGKAMPDQIRDHNRDEVERMLDKSFVVCLRRRDVWAQIVSWYLCKCTNRWHYEHDRPVSPSYEVGLHDTKLQASRRYILENNLKLEETWSSRAHINLWYEDLGDISSGFRRYDRPRDYDMVMQALQALGDLRTEDAKKTD